MGITSNLRKDSLLAYQEEFTELDLRDLISYLADDDLLVAKEDVVFDAAIRWLHHSPERQKYVSHVLGKLLALPLDKIIFGPHINMDSFMVAEAVRLPFISPEYLKNKVATEPLVCRSKECTKQVLSYVLCNMKQISLMLMFKYRNQVFEARTFQVSGRFREEFESVQRKPRRCTSKEVK